MVARFQKHRTEGSSVRAFAMVVASAYGRESSAALVALIRTFGRLADAVRFLLFVHVAFVQDEVVAFFEQSFAFVTPEGGGGALTLAVRFRLVRAVLFVTVFIFET